MCEERKWERVSFNPYTFGTYNKSEIAEPCENVRILAFWGPDECPKKVHLSICDLMELLEECKDKCNKKKAKRLIAECADDKEATEEKKERERKEEECREELSEAGKI